MSTKNAIFVLFGLLAAGASGCHKGGDTSPPDMAELPDLTPPEDMTYVPTDGGTRPPIVTTFPATLGAAMPQEQLANKEGVLDAPKVVAITYDGDPNRADYEAFFGNFAASTAWTIETLEYGVGPLTVLPPQHITTAMPTSWTDDAATTLLVAQLSGATPAWGAADSSTIYEFEIPAAMSFDDGQGGMCCSSYGGYHSEVLVAGVPVAYAINCTCNGTGATAASDGLLELTVTAAHETVEASTDPFYDTPGWAGTDDAHYAWNYATDGELADLCEFSQTANWKPDDMMYYVQRSWSNVAALAGKDPCVGAGAATYYQTVPYQGDDLKLYHGHQKGQGVLIPLNGIANVPMHVYGDPGTGPFTIKVYDFNSTFSGGTKYLDITNPTGTFNVGDEPTVSIKAASSDKSIGGAGFVVATKPASGQTTYYFGLVGNQ